MSKSETDSSSVARRGKCGSIRYVKTSFPYPQSYNILLLETHNKVMNECWGTYKMCKHQVIYTVYIFSIDKEAVSTFVNKELVVLENVQIVK